MTNDQLDGGGRRIWCVVGCLLVIGHWSLVISAEWLSAAAGHDYAFPRDHLPHPGFKTEWWYFTGNVHSADGRRFGYQATFFRQGLRSPMPPGPARSRFIVDDLKFAHFAVTDVAGKRFHFQQKVSRGAFGEAGFDQPEPGTRLPRIAWIDDWKLVRPAPARFVIAAGDEQHGVRFQLGEGKPWAIHGENGLSQKADGPGHASHYYSGTRLPTGGQLAVDGRTFEVTGESWFDHEWATNQLTPAQVGWDWFSLQLDDRTELMLYQMRTRAGGSDPNSSGTFIATDGATRHLQRGDYTLRPLAYWKSRVTGGQYPIAWELTVPSLALTARISTPVENQELVLTPIAYWEGVVDLRGTRDGRVLQGHGYMELTGYSGALVGLAAEVE